MNRKPAFNMRQQVFTRQDILEWLQKESPGFRDTQLRYTLGKMIDSGSIIREGRNRYIFADQDGRSNYRGPYSALAQEIAEEVSLAFPLLEIRVWELSWLNEFMNHQIAHNKIFIETERDACGHVYDNLAEKYKGRLMLMPATEDVYRYGVDDGLIISHLISEAPKSSGAPYETPIEKLLVDMFSNKYILSSVSRGDYPDAVEEMFSKYIINQKALLRYAKRRNRREEIIKFIKKETSVTLLED